MPAVRIARRPHHIKLIYYGKAMGGKKKEREMMGKRVEWHGQGWLQEEFIMSRLAGCPGGYQRDARARP